MPLATRETHTLQTLSHRLKLTGNSPCRMKLTLSHKTPKRRPGDVKMPNRNRQQSSKPSRRPNGKDSMNGLHLRDKLLLTGLLKHKKHGPGFSSLTALQAMTLAAHGEMAQATETLVCKRVSPSKYTTTFSLMDKILLILHTSTTKLDSFSMQLNT